MKVVMMGFVGVVLACAATASADQGKPALVAPDTDNMDMASMMLLLQQLSQEAADAQVEAAKGSISASKQQKLEQHQERLDKIQDAIEKQKEASANGLFGKVFGWIASASMIVAAIALFAVGGAPGTSALLIAAAAMALVSGSFDLEGSGVLEKLDLPKEDVVQMVAQLQIALGVVSASASSSASAASKAAAAAAQAAASIAAGSVSAAVATSESASVFSAIEAAASKSASRVGGAQVIGGLTLPDIDALPQLSLARLGELLMKLADATAVAEARVRDVLQKLVANQMKVSAAVAAMASATKANNPIKVAQAAAALAVLKVQTGTLTASHAALEALRASAAATELQAQQLLAAAITNADILKAVNALEKFKATVRTLHSGLVATAQSYASAASTLAKHGFHTQFMAQLAMYNVHAAQYGTVVAAVETVIQAKYDVKGFLAKHAA